MHTILDHLHIPSDALLHKPWNDVLGIFMLMDNWDLLTSFSNVSLAPAFALTSKAAVLICTINHMAEPDRKFGNSRCMHHSVIYRVSVPDIRKTVPPSAALRSALHVTMCGPADISSHR
jgi:hypothetical protein